MPLILAFQRQRQEDFWVQSRPGLHCEFQGRPVRASQLRPCLEKEAGRECLIIGHCFTVPSSPKEEIRALLVQLVQASIPCSLLTSDSDFTAFFSSLGLLILRIENLRHVLITCFLRTQWDGWNLKTLRCRHVRVCVSACVSAPAHWKLLHSVFSKWPELLSSSVSLQISKNSIYRKHSVY